MRKWAHHKKLSEFANGALLQQINFWKQPCLLKNKKRCSKRTSRLDDKSVLALDGVKLPSNAVIQFLLFDNI